VVSDAAVRKVIVPQVIVLPVIVLPVIVKEIRKAIDLNGLTLSDFG